MRTFICASANFLFGPDTEVRRMWRKFGARKKLSTELDNVKSAHSSRPHLQSVD